MNERRSELVERIHGEILSVYTDGYDHEVSDIVEHARRVITLVTKHRDAEIREALLDGEWLDTLHDELHAGMYWDTDDSRPIPDETYAHECLPYHVVRDQIEARLKHIGLAEEGAER